MEGGGGYPIGFRFKPKEDELVDYYLLPRLQGRPAVPNGSVVEANVYACHPETLIKGMAAEHDSPVLHFLPDFHGFAVTARLCPSGHRRAQGRGAAGRVVLRVAEGSHVRQRRAAGAEDAGRPRAVEGVHGHQGGGPGGGPQRRQVLQERAQLLRGQPQEGDQDQVDHARDHRPRVRGQARQARRKKHCAFQFATISFFLLSFFRF